MPATRAVASASPLGSPPDEINSTTCAVVRKEPAAIAVRLLAPFSVTSTIRAAPRSSMCESGPKPDGDVAAAPDISCLPVDHRDGVHVRQGVSRKREHQVAEGRQCAYP